MLRSTGEHLTTLFKDLPEKKFKAFHKLTGTLNHNATTTTLCNTM